jgi:hypothetical protein
MPKAAEPFLVTALGPCLDHAAHKNKACADEAEACAKALMGVLGAAMGFISPIIFAAMQQEKAAEAAQFRLYISQIEVSLMEIQRKEAIYINEISLHDTINESSRARDDLTKFVSGLKSQLNSRILSCDKSSAAAVTRNEHHSGRTTLLNIAINQAIRILNCHSQLCHIYRSGSSIVNICQLNRFLKAVGNDEVIGTCGPWV